jgi:RNA polymerase sigma-70 factor (subfamily 1)
MTSEGEISDEELVVRLRAGDEAAASLLFRRYEPVLRRRASRRLVGGVRRKVGASDIVQDTYRAAFRDLSQFEDRGPGSFRRWLDTILSYRVNESVRRHVRAVRRSVGREVSGEARPASADAAASGPTPSAEVAAKEQGEELRAAIEAMDGDDRLVLQLVGLDGRGYDDVGRVMGRSADAVRKLYARATVRLGRETGRRASGRRRKSPSADAADGREPSESP